MNIVWVCVKQDGKLLNAKFGLVGFEKKFLGLKNAKKGQ